MIVLLTRSLENIDDMLLAIPVMPHNVPHALFYDPANTQRESGDWFRKTTMVRQIS